MSRTRSRGLLLVLGIAGLLGGGCGTPPHWRQFRADEPNSGFLLVGSANAIRPAWEVNVGPVVYSSPVLDRDGNLYVGNMDGELVSVSPSGAIRWRTSFPGRSILSSPAVDSHERVYVITTQRMEDDSLRSALHRVRREDGALVWTRDLNAHSGASPKTRRQGGDDQIFVQVSGPQDATLVVFDGLGQQLQRQEVITCHVITGSSSITDFLSEVWDILTDFPVEFDPSGVPLYEQLGWPTPTPALVEEGREGNTSTVIVAGLCGLHAYRWSTPTFTFLWHFDFEDARRWSSPAVLGGVVAIGSEDGKVRARDILTGDARWTRDVGEPILATPAWNGRQVFVVSESKLTVLDGLDGTLEHQQGLSGASLASPAVTGSHVYVSTIRELTTYSFDLMTRAHETSVQGGVSSPAVARNGTVYVVDTAGILRAYPK